MAKFKVIKKVGDYAPLNMVVDGQLISNDKDPNWKVAFRYTSDATKQKGLTFAEYAAKDVNQFSQFFEPFDDAAKKMVSDFKEGKTITSTSETVQPPKELDNVINNLQSFSNRAKIMSTIGLAAGLGFAHYKKSSVKGYIGYALLFSFIGTLVAAASVKIVPPKK